MAAKTLKIAKVVEGGVYYWIRRSDAEAARLAYAGEHLATSRLVEFTLGWAVQAHVSGPYLSTEYPSFDGHRCRWCP